MIQRVQNLYLTLSAAALAWFLLSGLPGASGSDWQMFLIYGLGISALGLMVVALVHFKDRTKQRTFVMLALVEMVVFAAVAYGSLYFSGNMSVRTEAGLDGMRLAGLIMPAVAYIGTRLALGGIKRDIKLLESADRLR